MMMDREEVTERVRQIEGAINRLDSVRKHLSRNAAGIKSEIQSSVSRHLENVRVRELSLLSQVDQVSAAKEETLQAQRDRLHRAIGASSNHSLERIELSPEETPYISFRADHLTLREAIFNYGRVDAHGLPLATAFEDPSNPSASLPRHLEEYEDVEHHVFYKPVSENPLRQTCINVTIPKLSTRAEDWLQKKTPATTTPYSLGTTATSLPTSGLSTHASCSSSSAVRPTSFSSRGSGLSSRITELGHQGQACSGMSTTTPGSSCSLKDWLSLIKQHTDLEEEHDFEIQDLTAVQVAMPDVDDFFSHIVKDQRQWLLSGVRSTGKASLPCDMFKHIPRDHKVWLSDSGYPQKMQDPVTEKIVQHRPPSASSSSSPCITRPAHTSWLAPQYPESVSSGAKVGSADYVGAKGLDCGIAQPKVDFFKHISRNTSDWLAVKPQSPSKTSVNGETSSDSAQDSQDKWLQPRPVALELEDMCRANELCCSVTECVSKPDCVAMYFSGSGSSSRSGSSNSVNSANGDSGNVKNGGKFEQATDSTGYTSVSSSSCSNSENMSNQQQMDVDNIWLSPLSRNTHSIVETCNGLKKLKLDITDSAEIVEKSDEEAEKKKEDKDEKQIMEISEDSEGFVDFFHKLPAVGDPVWLSACSNSAEEPRVKGVKEEKNLTLQKNVESDLSASSLKEWLAAGGNRCDAERDDSEGWSIVSDSFSLQSEHQEQALAAADDFINKWLL